MRLKKRIDVQYDRLVDVETNRVVGKMIFKKNHKNYFTRNTNGLYRKRVLGSTNIRIKYYL